MQGAESKQQPGEGVWSFVSNRLVDDDLDGNGPQLPRRRAETVEHATVPRSEQLRREDPGHGVGTQV